MVIFAYIGFLNDIAHTIALTVRGICSFFTVILLWLFTMCASGKNKLFASASNVPNSIYTASTTTAFLMSDSSADICNN